ncbi:Holliday junction branch migration DNA helicase RuvB [Roseofilum casamattae]|uniref:Holliday junction branch migration complex subunit RuvB n=1 Tax=Roseofilum casamattae BLCC-M143 TaxID=3022442 RepID=A0ABT7BZV6_9CYAN|nr:Holliday junction branch migration DNA helicase RuvB [Roseofilum casamattae]MDJ1183966.1 Holliday junction branch migration DNA helicase RuvB [Roseofilum casamattae BLCC-M143]
MAIESSFQPSSESGKRRVRSPKQKYQAKAKRDRQEEEIEESLLQAEARLDETENQEEKLRPHRLADYVGQKDLKGVLQIAIDAAKARKEPLDHLLLYGPPGLGKTTMSLILAQEMGVNCKISAAPALEKPRDIVGLLISLQAGDILFLDEIHRLSRVTEELLYPAMEDRRLDITVGKGKTAKTRSIPLKPFTLVGATTRVGSLSSPLRDRFGLIQRLRFYELDELSIIVERAAGVLHTEITPEGATEIARRSRGTPRIANRLLRRVRDYAQVKELGAISQDVADTALQLYDVDPCGLDWTDRLILSTTIENFSGGPVGLETLAAATGEDSQTIEEVYEPYLLQIGFLQRTSRGRVVLPAAWKHLGYTHPDEPYI